MGRTSLLISVTSVLFLGACSSSGGGQQPPVSAQPASRAVPTERRVSAEAVSLAQSAPAPVGASCDLAAGGAGCASRLCVAAINNGVEGSWCTHACSQTPDCSDIGSQWVCVSTYPAPEATSSRLCLPMSHIGPNVIAPSDAG